MFSGIIQGIGTINKIESDNLFIKTSVNLNDIIIGSSISCNGVCLTATSINKIDNSNYIFSVNISEETKTRSTFKFPQFSKYINIEKSLKIGDEISGHFVYGHVDCVTEISKIQKLDASWTFEFKKNLNMKKFIVEKGSISINGVSLTISKIRANSFQITVIPHTLKLTNLINLKRGDKVNVEFDMVGKYLNNIYN